MELSPLGGFKDRLHKPLDMMDFGERQIEGGTWDE